MEGMEVLPRLLLGAACAIYFAYGCGSPFSGGDVGIGGGGGGSGAAPSAGKGGKASAGESGRGGETSRGGGSDDGGSGGQDGTGLSGAGAVIGAGGGTSVEPCIIDPDGDGSCAGAIASGAYSTCAIQGAGTVRCWGFNVNNRLGDGVSDHETCLVSNEDCSTVPVSVLGVTDARSLLGGENTFCMLDAEHALQCWGWDVTSGTDIGAGSVQKFGNFSAQAASMRLAIGALDEQGQIWMGGYDPAGGGIYGDGSALGGAIRELAPIPDLSGALAIDLGWFHACAVLDSKQVACWGQGTSGVIGDGELQNRPTPRPVIGLDGLAVLAVAAGDAVSCALVQGGSVWCWGSNNYGQLGNEGDAGSAEPVNVHGLTDAVEIDAGYGHVCARRATGNVVCWGNDLYGQLGDLDDHDACSAAMPEPCAHSPVEVSELDDAVAISLGRLHSCALRASGDIVCWGQNYYGQLGNGSFENAVTPSHVTEL